MWPLYLLLNKILRLDEEHEAHMLDSGADCPNVVEHCQCDFSPSRISQSAEFPRSYFVKVPHINQLFSWDCGLACVLMVLRTVGINYCNSQELADLCSSTRFKALNNGAQDALSYIYHNIWTVDLAYILQKFSVTFSYFTITVGANPNYSVETFYKDQLPDDQVRVDMLFKKALEAGINIQCRSINAEEISRFILSGNYVAIALVDQYKLSKSWLEDVIISGFDGSNSGYTGHYVVICGYDTDADEFEIRDPANSRKPDRVSSKCLEEARKSFGTDEDLLLISLEKEEKVNRSFSRRSGNA